MRSDIRAAVLVVLVAAGGTGCATSRAESPAEHPALDVPIPPPRVITPLPPPEIPGPEPVADLPPAGVNAPSRPRPPQREKETAAGKPEQKPEEPKPAEPPPANAPPANAPPAPAPVPQLRIQETGDTAQSAAHIKGLIERIRTALDSIDYRLLSDQRKKAYDDAKLFNTQADEALKGNNLVFAKELADKAERLAKELQGR